MADMSRESCMKVFEKYDPTAVEFHNAHPKAFSENSVTYAKYLLRIKKEVKIS